MWLPYQDKQIYFRMHTPMIEFVSQAKVASLFMYRIGLCTRFRGILKLNAVVVTR